MSLLFLKGIEQAYKGGIDVTSDTFRFAFMATSYTPNATTDEFFSDISASVATGTTVQTLTNPTFVIDGANARVEFDADNVSLSGVTTTTNKFVIYKWTGVEATSVLLASVDITEGTLSTINGTLSITFSADGIFAIKSTA